MNRVFAAFLGLLALLLAVVVLLFVLPSAMTEAFDARHTQLRDVLILPASPLLLGAAAVAFGLFPLRSTRALMLVAGLAALACGCCLLVIMLPGTDLETNTVLLFSATLFVCAALLTLKLHELATGRQSAYDERIEELKRSEP